MTNEQRKFAEILQKSGDPYDAGRAVFPDDDDAALTAAEEWPEELEAVGLLKKDEIPTRADLIDRLLERIENPATDTDDYVKGIKVAAEIAGYTKTVVVEKEGVKSPYADPSTIGTTEEAEAAYRKLMGGGK